jgi:hypothetical protein
MDGLWGGSGIEHVHRLVYAAGYENVNRLFPTAEHLI